MADPRQAARPLSPHLQIYRLTVTMVMSIVHRITGAGLYAGTLLLAWWLVAVATGPEAYAVFEGFIGSWFGRLVLFGYTWALIHHMLGGIRHFVWDFGKGFDLRAADLMAWGTVLGSVVLTVLVWVAGYAMMGAL
ncbi:MAG: succinate dehydrogenase, cytochrome b556 subunit [Parvibaculum sp.]|uniref:succinate dehydrogenase, cytochrome b556 subunit n=1 Tax=Parvibaculum sp. TaxID=2024848 RepID=UPI0032EAF2E0